MVSSPSNALLFHSFLKTVLGSCPMQFHDFIREVLLASGVLKESEPRTN